MILNPPKKDQLKQILTLKAKLFGLKLEHVFTVQELTETLNKSSIRKVLNRASDYFNYKAHNIPLPDNKLIKQPINLEEKVKELESALKQIAHLINPFVKVNNQQIDVEKIGKKSQSIKEIEFNKQEENRILELPHKQKTFNYLDRKKELLNQEYKNFPIITDADDIGKLTTIIENFKICFPHLEIEQLRLGKRTLPEHLFVKNQQNNYVISFLHIGGLGFTTRLNNFNQLVIVSPKYKFQLFRDTREPEIKGEVGKRRIKQLNNTKNGQFILMDQENRVNFELIYNLIIDIQEQDLEVDLTEAIKLLPDYFKSYWLISLLELN